MQKGSKELVEEIIWVQYKDNTQPVRDGVQQTKVQVNLKLAKAVKSNWKGYYKYIGGKIEHTGLLLSEAGKLVTKDMNKRGTRHFLCLHLYK